MTFRVVWRKKSIFIQTTQFQVSLANAKFKHDWIRQENYSEIIASYHIRIISENNCHFFPYVDAVAISMLTYPKPGSIDHSTIPKHNNNCEDWIECLNRFRCEWHKRKKKDIRSRQNDISAPFRLLIRIQIHTLRAYTRTHTHMHDLRESRRWKKNEKKRPSEFRREKRNVTIHVLTLFAISYPQRYLRKKQRKEMMRSDCVYLRICSCLA